MSRTMEQLVEHALSDPKFLQELMTNPTKTTKDYNLTDQERSFFTGNTAERLMGLTPDQPVPTLVGCGSTPTCTATCTATCTHTFTKVIEA
jgi:hypothetical protein